MAIFGFGKKGEKTDRRDPGDRAKQAGAREYEAKRQDRIAERRQSEGDLDGAQMAREAAAEARRPRRRSDNS